MDQLFFARIKDVKFQPKDGEIAYVVQLKAALEPDDLRKLALFGDRSLMVHFHINEAGETKRGHQQGSLFDPEPKIDGSGVWRCSVCGGILDGLICHECGQRHREPAKPQPEAQPESEPEPQSVRCDRPATVAIHYGTGESAGTFFGCAEHAEVFRSAQDTVRSVEEYVQAEGGQVMICEYESPAEDPDPLCICGHPLSLHGAPGEPCRGDQGGDVCDCTIFKSTAEAADAEVDPEAEAAEQEPEEADAAEELGQIALVEDPVQ